MCYCAGVWWGYCIIAFCLPLVMENIVLCTSTHLCIINWQGCLILHVTCSLASFKSTHGTKSFYNWAQMRLLLSSVYWVCSVFLLATHFQMAIFWLTITVNYCASLIWPDLIVFTPMHWNNWLHWVVQFMQQIGVSLAQENTEKFQWIIMCCQNLTTFSRFCLTFLAW